MTTGPQAATKVDANNPVLPTDAADSVRSSIGRGRIVAGAPPTTTGVPAVSVPGAAAADERPMAAGTAVVRHVGARTVAKRAAGRAATTVVFSTAIAMNHEARASAGQRPAASTVRVATVGLAVEMSVAVFVRSVISAGSIARAAATVARVVMTVVSTAQIELRGATTGRAFNLRAPTEVTTAQIAGMTVQIVARVVKIVPQVAMTAADSVPRAMTAGTRDVMATAGRAIAMPGSIGPAAHPAEAIFPADQSAMIGPKRPRCPKVLSRPCSIVRYCAI